MNPSTAPTSDEARLQLSFPAFSVQVTIHRAFIKAEFGHEHVDISHFSLN